MTEKFVGKIDTDTKESPKRTWGIGKPKPRFKNGVYEGEAKGYHGITRVRVTVKEEKLSAIEILSYEDYSEFFEPAEKNVIPRLLKEQHFSVVPTAGATFSSSSIINAVKQALEGE